MPDPKPRSPTSPQEQTCPKCGWSLLSSGRSAEAHAATCEGLGAPRLPRFDDPPEGSG